MARFNYRHHKYLCAAGHETLKLMESSAVKSHVRCGRKGCRRRAFHQRLAARIIAAKPIVYYENAKGEKWVPPDDTTRCPFPEYQRQEIPAHDIMAVRRFERQMARDRTNLERQIEERQLRGFVERRDRDHAELREMMKGMDAEHRDLAEEFLRLSQEGYSRPVTADFFVGAYS
ncbi:MAG: hypothetical protein M3416_01330 [Acidobacteriota bacterium]|nr:hypothetical protein [Acidobacteriota bacterium]